MVNGRMTSKDHSQRIFIRKAYILAPRNNGLLGLKSGLGPARPASPYTVGLNIIDSKTINGAGGVYFLNQMTAGGGTGNQEFRSYYTPIDNIAGNGYYDIEQNNSTYYQIISEPII